MTATHVSTATVRESIAEAIEAVEEAQRLAEKAIEIQKLRHGAMRIFLQDIVNIATAEDDAETRLRSLEDALDDYAHDLALITRNGGA